MRVLNTGQIFAHFPLNFKVGLTVRTIFHPGCDPLLTHFFYKFQPVDLFERFINNQYSGIQ
jgi:hypothetical protein